MFDDLQERMRRDDLADITPRERQVRNSIVIVLAVVVFGGLYAVLRFVEF